MDSQRHDELPIIDPEAFQQEISALSDVRAARVVTDLRGRITEIHVVTEGGKSPKSIVRDVQTIAQARFGTQIDYRIVSVVQFGEEPVPLRSGRLALSSVSWTTDGTQSSCRVELEGPRGLATGEVSGAATSIGRMRLTAQAAVKALQQADGMGTVIDVADVTVAEVGGRKVAVTMLVVLAGSSEEILVGAALVRTDESEAVARSALDAFNRRVAPE